MNESAINLKQKVNSFALFLVLAINFIFPISANSQTVMEWMVLSIMRSRAANFGQSFQTGGADNLWLEITDAGQETAFFGTKDDVSSK